MSDPSHKDDKSTDIHDQPTTAQTSNQGLKAAAERGRSDTPLRSPGQRYEILGEAGRGGMGVVFRARDRETGELVALKVLKPEIAADAAAIERFKTELKLARKVTHKNVCRIHEFNRTADGLGIHLDGVCRR
jgi:serine/threonine protein kinase